jgi:2'-5' RNA ligase
MSVSALVVLVPEAEDLVSSLRDRLDASAKLGVPAHITVLVPFMSPEAIDAAVLERIQRVASEIGSFRFALAQVGRFPETAYLEPAPAAPFVALTERLLAEFPKFPPFAGAFPTIIPHLTVAHGSASDAAAAATELVTRLALRGPVKSECVSLVLLGNSSGRWTPMHTFALGPYVSRQE